MGIQINGQTDTISSTDGSLNIGGTVTVNVTGDATGLTGTPDITVGAVTASSATISGDLTVNGTTTTLDTTLTEVDKLEVGANNTTVGVAITQSGTGDILRLYDSSTQVVTVKDGGNFGVGPTSPEELLHLSSSSPKIKITDTTTGADHLLDGDSGVGTFWVKVDDNAEGSNPAFIVDVAGTERLRINSNGAIGIGTASPQQSNIPSIHLNTNTSDDARIAITTPTKPNSRIGYFGLSDRFGMDVYNGFQIRDASSSYATRFTIDTSGQVIAGSATLNYQGTATPYNNNNLTLTGTQSIGLIGQYSAINWPSDHSNAVTTEPWYMMGRPHGTTDRWSLVIRPGGSNNRYNIIDCYNNANGTIESLRFGTNAGNEALRITSTGRVGIGSDNPSQKLDVQGGIKVTQGLKSVYSLGSIPQNTTVSVYHPYDSVCLIGASGDVVGLFTTKPTGGSIGCYGIFTTGSPHIVYGTTSEPSGGAYLRIWYDSAGSTMYVKNVNTYQGPYDIVVMATF